MIHMTAEQAAEFGIADLDVTPGSIAIVSEAKLAEIVAAAAA